MTKLNKKRRSFVVFLCVCVCVFVSEHSTTIVVVVVGQGQSGVKIDREKPCVRPARGNVARNLILAVRPRLVKAPLQWSLKCFYLFYTMFSC